MIGILKKQHGMNIVGQGAKIILFTLPSLIAAIWVHVQWPASAALPASLAFLKPVGYLMLIPGVALWLAAVVTTEAIAASFANGMEFFSTFGGNPVACAAGLAVLDVMAEEGLQERALRVGEHFIAGLRRLAERHPIVGDVRGSGLFLGIELVRDRRTLEPAAAEAAYVVERLRERGILTGTDGPLHNVLKVRPPLCFTEEDADLFVSVLDEVLAEDPVRPQGEERR